MERIKFFLWLGANEALNTNDLRHSGHLSSSPYCSRCNEDLNETILHVLRDYTVIGDFWKRRVPGNLWPSFSTSSLRRWLLDNLSADWSVESHHWSLVFGTALYYLWRVRKEELFQYLTPSSSDIYERFWSMFVTYTTPISMNSLIGHRNVRHLNYIRWFPPPDSWLKINSDGSMHGDGFAACGGVIRDSAGQLLHVFSANIGSCPITVVELRGALHALHLA